MCVFLIEYMFLIVLQCVPTFCFSFSFHISLHITENINHGRLISSISKNHIYFMLHYKVLKLLSHTLVSETIVGVTFPFC